MGGDGDQAVQVDQGHAHLSIPRMEIKLQLDDALQWCPLAGQQCFRAVAAAHHGQAGVEGAA